MIERVNRLAYLFSQENVHIASERKFLRPEHASQGLGF